MKCTKNFLIIGFLSVAALVLFFLPATVLHVSHRCCAQAGHADLNLSHFDIHALKQMNNIIPIVILGSGPAGLSAAVYAGRAGFYTVVFEGHLAGGLLTQTTLVENWPGSIEINGPDIIKNLRDQALKWGVQFSSDVIERVDFTVWPFKLFTAEGKEVNALSVILATGATPRKLGIPGEQEYWSKGVTTCAVCDAPFYKGQDVVVIGGGDSAAEEAMQLAPYAKNITVLVRGDKMRASKAMQDRLKGFKQISIMYNVEPKEIQGNEHEVTGIKLFNNRDKTDISMPIGGVFLAIGHIPNTKFLDKAVALTDDGHVYLRNRTQITSVNGVMAAGDNEDTRYRQAGVAAGHGISAALDATFFLNEIGYNEHVEHQLRGEKRLMSIEEEVDYTIPEIKRMDEFQTAVLDADIPVIVDFYAEWCSSCMQMLPAVLAVASEYQDKVRFVKVDADQAEEIMKQYHVQNLPTILAFKDGQIVARFAKALTKVELIEYVKGLIE